MDMLARDAAREGGAALFLRVPALGTRPDFIAALADVVRRGEAGQAAPLDAVTAAGHAAAGAAAAGR
jgi:hypothetical protein